MLLCRLLAVQADVAVTPRTRQQARPSLLPNRLGLIRLYIPAVLAYQSMLSLQRLAHALPAFG